MTRSILTVFFQIVLIFLTGEVLGQSYPGDILSHKIIVNEDDRTIVAYVKPTRGLPVEPDNQYFSFSGNKIQITQGGYSGKLLHGGYKEWYSNKNLKELGFFYKGLKTGVWKSWTENGKLSVDYTWNFGKKNGRYHKYDSLGKVVEKGKYKNGVLNGKQELLTGDSTKTIVYKNGKVKVAGHKSIIPGFIRRMFSK